MQNPEQPIRHQEIKNFARHLMREIGEKSGLSRNQKCPQLIFKYISNRY